MSEYLRVLPQIAELPFLPGYPIEKMHNFYGFSVLLLSDLFSRMVVEFVSASLMDYWSSAPGGERTLATGNSSVEFKLGFNVSPGTPHQPSLDGVRSHGLVVSDRYRLRCLPN